MDEFVEMFFAAFGAVAFGLLVGYGFATGVLKLLGV